MTIRLRQLFGVIVGAVIAVATLPAVAKTPSAKADALLSGVFGTNSYGAAVLVAQDGKILFEKGYGLADVEHHVPITPQTTFRIASITKPFTASAILKLQEEGKLSVDDKLSKYIPDFPRGNEVTLRELLTHKSGIHSYTEVADFESRATRTTTTEAIIEWIEKHPYDFDPGTKFLYDNSGYLLLSHIVEKVSGQSYEDFLRENFFQPLGMTNTGVYRGHLGLSHEALGYGMGTNSIERAPDWDRSWSHGADGLYSTVEDLYRWNEGIFNGRVLDAASLKAAFTPVETGGSFVFHDTNGDGYGFGWFIDHHRGLHEIWHGGSMPGFESVLLRVPDEKFTVVVLANARPANALPLFLAQQLVEIFLADNLASLPSVVNTNISPGSYEALAGRYELQARGRIYTISIDKLGTRLFMRNADQWTEIFPESDTEFFIKGVDEHLTFEKESSGKAAKLIVNNMGIDINLTRIGDPVEVKVDPAVYDSLVGKYDYGKYGVLTVTREGSHLCAQLTGFPKREIFPVSEMEYYWTNVNAQITFVKDAAGKVTKAIHHQNGLNSDVPKIQ